MSDKYFRITGLLKRRKRMKTIAFILSVIVVFSTTYSMILPAITLSDSAAEAEPGILFEDTEELTAGEETEFTYEEEYTEEFPEEPETEPEAEAEPDPEWDYEYEEEAEEWDSDPGETEEVDDLALEGAEENLYEAEDAVTTEDGADDQPEAGQTEVQTETASQDDAESVTVSPEVYEEFLTSEQSAQDGRYLIVRITVKTIQFAKLTAEITGFFCVNRRRLRISRVCRSNFLMARL